MNKSRKVLLNYNEELKIFTVTGKDGNIYKVLNSDITGAKTKVYSTPSNPKHKAWTPYKITKPIREILKVVHHCLILMTTATMMSFLRQNA